MKTFLLFFTASFCLACTANTVPSEPIAIIPFQISGGLIYVQLQVDEEKDLNFIFDTGASVTVVNRELGKKLGLKNGRRVSQTGAAGSEGVSLFSDHKIQLKQATIEDIDLLMGDRELPSASVLEEEADGIIGYDVLARYVVNLNYEKKEITLYPKGFDATGFGQKYSFTKPYNIPMMNIPIKVGEERYEGKFLIDTGASLNLVLNSPFVNDNEIIEKVGKHYSTTQEVGISGASMKITATRVDEISFLDQPFLEVPVGLSHAKSGVLSYSNFEGVLGNKLIKRFHITFDYANNVLYAKPNVKLTEAFQSDCFGLLFKKKNIDGKRLIVKEVVEASPAADVGIMVGDELKEIAGKKAVNYGHDELAELLEQAGQEIHIIIVRNGQEIAFDVKLKQLI